MRKHAIKLLGSMINRLDKRAALARARARNSFKPPSTKSYDAANLTRLLSSWPTSPININNDLYASLGPVRARSRDLVKNNPYARKFIHMVGTNVVGAKGVTFQSKVRTPKGKLDRQANKKIENAWKKWTKRKYASKSTTLSWLEIQHVFIKTVARDGECFLRKILDKENKFGFSLQFIETDLLDTMYNVELKNGNIVVLGVELDEWKKPVAYHFKKKKHGVLNSYYTTGERERVDASEIIHGFRPEYPDQVRDVSWLSCGAMDVKMLDGYKESALVKARIGASKMGFIITPTGTEYKGDSAGPDGEVINEVEPGLLEQLPIGWDFKPFDPKSEAGDLDPFMTKEMQSIASGWNVSYVSLANDQKGTSYSADRSSKVEERDNWMVIQEWLIEILHEEVFETWLDMSLLTGALTLPISKYDKFNHPYFQPKRWKWVDPLKDEKANSTALENKTTSRTRISAEQGRDIEDIADELKWEVENIVIPLQKLEGADVNNDGSGKKKGDTFIFLETDN